MRNDYEKVMEIMKELARLKVSAEVLGEYGFINKSYSNPTRAYHNWDHIINVLQLINERFHATGYGQTEKDILFLAAVFHDIIYDPKATDNEEQSMNYFQSVFRGSLHTKGKVCEIIMSTIDHKSPEEGLPKFFNRIDVDSALDHSFKELIWYEDKIFSEYQFVDYNVYKVKRIEVLQDFYTEYKHPNVKPLIEYISARVPKIGIYPGSFNPFHLGHLNILEKAEEIFDKVIIAQGVNPSKSGEQKPIFSVNALNNRQTVQYDGLLTDYLNTLGYDVTIIRGLRNGSDLQYETTQYRFLQDFMPSVKVISIFCDKEFEHISSSAVRSLVQYDKNIEYTVQ